MNPKIDSNGNKFWHLNGLLHREDGPAIEWADGGKSWYKNGKRHRLDGSAVECANGDKDWWINGKLHRLDGPAIEWVDGEVRCEGLTGFWYLNGTDISEELHYKLTQGSIKDLPLYLGLGCDEYISERLKNES